MLLPVDLAVDSNRDGVIKFAGNFDDDAVSGKPFDTTSQDKPFRFWINDDQDDQDVGETASVTVKDYTNHEITYKRNLEDFSRLWINIGGLQDAISKGTIMVGLKWKDTTGTPAINIYKAADPDGGSGYLTSDDDANAQVTGEYDVAIADKNGKQTVDANGTYILPSDFWDGLSSDSPNKYLLFEGAGEGKGQLCIAFYDTNGNPLGDGPGVWLELLNIKKMYQRGSATPDFADRPYGHTDSWSPPAVGSQPYDNGYPFSKPVDEEKKAIVYVHGINGPGGQPNAYATWMCDSETVFKRLWHQGFKGRFATFKWLALTPASDSTIPNPSEFLFNDSEYRGWKCGQGLAQFINTLPDASGYAKNIYSFSQGAIVCGAALSVPGCSVSNYVLSQAAAPAGSYDTTTAINSYTDFLNAEATNPTPDSTNDLGYRGYLSGLNVTGSVVSFFNQVDYALKTGKKTVPVLGTVNTSWEGNQINFKPDANAVMHNNRVYAYDSGPPNSRFAIGQRCFLRDVGWPSNERLLTDIHESMSFVARPRSEAAGASASVSGRISSRYNVGPDTASNFRDGSSDHGGQFSRSIQQTGPYFKNLLGVFTEE